MTLLPFFSASRFFYQIIMGSPIKTQNHKAHFTFTILDAWHLKVTHIGFVGVSRRIWLYFIKISFKRQKVIQVGMINDHIICTIMTTTVYSDALICTQALQLPTHNLRLYLPRARRYRLWKIQLRDYKFLQFWKKLCQVWKSYRRIVVKTTKGVCF